MSDWNTQLDQFICYLSHEKFRSTHTCQAYRRDLSHLATLLQEQKVNHWHEVEEKHLRKVIVSLHKKKLSSRSIQRSLSSVRSFYNFLITRGQVQSNPAASVRAPKGEKRLPKPPDVDQMQSLLLQTSDNPLDIRDLAIIELTYSCGLRLGEIQNLNLSDIDLTDQSACVHGKSGQRVLPIGKYAINALKKWLKIRTNLAKDLALFVTTKGTRLGARQIQKRLKANAQKNLGKHLHPHQLRHAFASHLLESSGNLRAVQELLGHRNLSTTQVYTHLNFQHLASVYDQTHPRAIISEKKKT